MKVLLINPPSDNMLTTEVPSIVNEERGANPPLGLLYLASVIRKDSPYKVAVLDTLAEELSHEEIERRIQNNKPDVVGLSIMTFTLIDCMIISKMIKKIDPEIKIIWGGPHVNIFPEESISLDYVDFVVLGEGEANIVPLLDAIGAGTGFEDVIGIVYQEKGEIKRTKPNSLIMDLDSIPFPARDLTNIKLYSSLLAKRSQVTTMITSRGCPYKCIFCDRPHLGKVFRARSAANVVEEMEQIVNQGIHEVLIYDDTFTIDRQRVVDICNSLIEKKLDLSWDIRARVNTVDLELLKLMKKAGCERIHYGIESGNQEILNILKKGITLEQAEKAFALTRKAGIGTLGYFMIGSPGETRETIMETINFAKKLKADFCHFSITTPFPATPLFDIGLKEGTIKYDYWKEFAKNPTKEFVPGLWEENLSKEELIELLTLAYKKFYTRPTYILKRILNVKSFEELKRKAKAGIKVLKL